MHRTYQQDAFDNSFSHQMSLWWLKHGFYYVMFAEFVVAKTFFLISVSCDCFKKKYTFYLKSRVVC